MSLPVLEAGERREPDSVLLQHKTTPARFTRDSSYERASFLHCTTSESNSFADHCTSGQSCDRRVTARSHGVSVGDLLQNHKSDHEIEMSAIMGMGTSPEVVRVVEGA